MNLIDLLLTDPLYRLVVRVISLQLVILLAVVAAVILIRLRRIRQRRERRSANARIAPILVQYLCEEVPLDAVVRALRPLPKEETAELLEAYAASISSRLREDLVELYRSLGLIDFAVRRSRSLLWWRRLEAVRILTMLDGKEAPEILFERLRDTSSAVRLVAARGLGRSGDPRAVDPLLASLATPSGLSRPQIAAILVDLGAPAHSRLRALLRKPPQTRAEARLYATVLEVLALSGDTRSAPYIQYALTDQDHEIRIAAYRAAGILRLTLAPDDIIMGLEDDRWEVRAQAARTAGRVGLKEVVPYLAARLSDTSWWVRLNSAAALRDLDHSGLAELGRIADSSNDPYARDMAQRVLTEDPRLGSNYLLGRGVTMLNAAIAAPSDAPSAIPAPAIENFWADSETEDLPPYTEFNGSVFDAQNALPDFEFETAVPNSGAFPPLVEAAFSETSQAADGLPPLAFDFDDSPGFETAPTRSHTLNNR